MDTRGQAKTLTVNTGNDGRTYDLYLSYEGAAYGNVTAGRVSGRSNGLYTLTLTAAEMDHVHIDVLLVSRDVPPNKYTCSIDTDPAGSGTGTTDGATRAQANAILGQAQLIIKRLR